LARPEFRLNENTENPNMQFEKQARHLIPFRRRRIDLFCLSSLRGVGPTGRRPERQKKRKNPSNPACPVKSELI